LFEKPASCVKLAFLSARGRLRPDHLLASQLAGVSNWEERRRPAGGALGGSCY